MKLQLALAREERPAKLVTRPCQCEHVSHFESDQRTPNGNPAHKYGVEYAERVLVRKNKSFEICRDCDEDCWQGVQLS